MATSAMNRLTAFKASAAMRVKMPAPTLIADGRAKLAAELASYRNQAR